MFPVIDTMSIETALLRKSWRSRLKQFFRGRGESVRLPDSRERYGLPRYQLHSAKVDALATAELLQAQINHHFPQDMLVTRLFD
jgi:DNA polymerase-3 subunit epsilon